MSSGPSRRVLLGSATTAMLPATAASALPSALPDCPVAALARTAARRLADMQRADLREDRAGIGLALFRLTDTEDDAAALRATSLAGALFQLMVANASAAVLLESEADQDLIDASLRKIRRCVTSAAELLIAAGVAHDAAQRDYYLPSRIDPFAVEAAPCPA